MVKNLPAYHLASLFLIAAATAAAAIKPETPKVVDLGEPPVQRAETIVEAPILQAPIAEVPRDLLKRVGCSHSNPRCSFLVSTADAVSVVFPARNEIGRYVYAGGFKIDGIAVSSGQLYAVGSGWLRLFRLEGGWMQIAKLDATGLCADADGRLFAATADGVVEIELEPEYSIRQTTGPTSVDCGAFRQTDLATVGVTGLATIRGTDGTFGVTQNGDLLWIDPETGQSRTLQTFEGVAFTGAATQWGAHDP